MSGESMIVAMDGRYAGNAGAVSGSRALRRIGTGLILALFAATALAATDSLPSTETIITVPLADTDIVPTEYNGDLRDLPQVTYTVPRYLHMWNDFEEPRRSMPPFAATNEPAAPVVPLAPMPAASKNFAGLGFSDSVTGGTAGAGWPPDTNGDVGPTVYIQAVNDAFGIFDKATGNRLTALTEDQLWNAAGTGTPCHGNNQGDPVVLHDGLADRWILTNFAFAVSAGKPVAPFYQCFAVSMTSDPVSGGWRFYAVRMDPGGAGQPANGLLNDYPKFGLWNDGCLYMASNEFDPTQPQASQFQGTAFASFNKANMYAGAALTGSIGFLGNTNDAFTMIPSNLLGTSAGSMPPAGTPNYFVSESTTVFDFEVRKFTPGANCGAGGAFSTTPTQVSQTSYAYNGNDYVPQNGTTNVLDPLEDRLMQKVQYRKIGSVESLWVVHTVGNGSATPAQPQWAQINVTNKTIATTPVQQQIYAPDTTLYRWMGSLAVDSQGNMALGYSTSSASAFPSIAYSGRLAADPLNQLPQSETVLQAGAGSQTLKLGSPAAFVSRWGDYSAMSIDPADDCTFWYTNEYYDTQANGTSGHWQTRIGAFKFPGCIAPAAKLAFTLQPNTSYASGATITVKVSIEDAAGNVVTGDTSAVTVALSGGTAGAVLSGTKTVNAVAGVATFSTLAVDKIGTSYVLNAADGSLTAAASSAFNITVGTAKTVTFTTQPVTNANVAAGVTVPIVAHVVDGGGNPVSAQSIALSILNNPGSSTLSVTTNPVTTDVNGNATFAGVSLNKIGTGYTLKATDATTPAATPVTSNGFNIVAGVGKTVTFTTQPATNSNVAAGATIPAVAHVVDVGGNGVANESITLGFNNNAGGSVLSVTANPVATNASGDATFANVSLNQLGLAYTLAATDSTTPAAMAATSNAFNIVAGTPTQLLFLQQPTNGTAGIALSPAVTVKVLDASNNVVVADSNSVTLAVVAGSPGGFDPGATVTAAFSNGVATFNNLIFDVAGVGYQLRAADAGDSLTSASSSTFTIAPGAPRLVFTTEPVTVPRGNALGTVAVTENDGSGNVIPDNTSSVDFTITTACGTFDLGSVAMSSGVATLMSSQRFYTLASGLTINASTGVLSGTSAGFSVISSDLLFADSFDGCRL